MQLLQLQHQNRMFPCSVKETNKSRCLSADVMVLCEKKQKRRKDYKTITESETCIEIEKKKTKVFQFFLLFQLSRHSVNHTTTSPHPVFFFFFFLNTDTHIHNTHTRDEMCGALRYAALPQSCLAYSWTTDVTEREWLERREEATTVLLEKSVCPQLSVSVSTCKSCLAASQSPELSIL